MNGTIKKLAIDKKFGFIIAEGLAKDLFFHANALVGVSFEELRERYFKDQEGRTSPYATVLHG